MQTATNPTKSDGQRIASETRYAGTRRGASGRVYTLWLRPQVSLLMSAAVRVNYHDGVTKEDAATQQQQPYLSHLVPSRKAYAAIRATELAILAMDGVHVFFQSVPLAAAGQLSKNK